MLFAAVQFFWEMNMSLLSSSPESPPLMTLSLTPACASNCASKGLGRKNELCARTRSSAANASEDTNNDNTAQVAGKTRESNRRFKMNSSRQKGLEYP